MLLESVFPTHMHRSKWFVLKADSRCNYIKIEIRYIMEVCANIRIKVVILKKWP